MHDILFVSGTRPEIIKLAPLYHALQQSGWANTHWLHTGQHLEMATKILDCFDIVPDTVFERTGTSLLDFSTGCKQQLDVVMREKPWALVVVQGDTESAFLGALTGFYNRIPVAHVEAGLRTHNLERPFPEEGLRQMLSRLARFHFCPTPRARFALENEGIADEKIYVTGNTVVDAQQWTCARHGIRRYLDGRGHLLVTIHRRENWGDDVAEICRAIAEIAQQHPDLEVLFPVHLNPVVHRPVHEILGNLKNVTLVPPLDYVQMQQALADAWLVLTDSGGLQEEAPTFGVPVLVLREETERPEALEAGCALLAGARRETIVREVNALLAGGERYASMSRAGNPFGDGTASAQIVEILAETLTEPAAAEAASVLNGA